MKPLTFIIICFFYLSCFFLCYVAYLAKKRNEFGAFVNNFANSLVLIVAITINLIIVNYLEISNIHFIVFPFDILIIFFIIIFTPIFGFFTIREKKKNLKNKRKNYKSNPKPEFLPLKYDIYRKLAHLVVLGIILFHTGFFN